MTVSALLCILYVILLSSTLQVTHNNCVHSSTPNNNSQDFSHNIYNNKTNSEQPVNPTNIDYMHTPLNVCDLHTGPNLLLVLVKSDVLNIPHRLSIRKTWGNISNPHIKVMYLLGYNSIVQDMIVLESNLYKDVLQGDFVDNYDHNINKTAMAYQYAVERCPNTKFLFFVDDDFVINILKIKEYLKTLTYPYISKLFSGFIIKKGKPYRNKSSKWYISRKEYPYDSFPTYPAGGAILMSMTIAQLLKAEFPHVRYITIDDVYLGIVAMKLKLQLQNDKRFVLTYTPPLNLKNVFASHGYKGARNLLVKWDVFLASMSFNSSTDINRELNNS
ncbi:putative enzyme (brainiac) [Mytilus galloprovincialis]|uniref:Hexosyltransferase n=1 Tax=Mytilus galloprovincialis TaxID=29158 RepID=A0A8B6E364_MYTGA|nr:putative enzyme (brainiac) [Mytilus galloprovincialis]